MKTNTNIIYKRIFICFAFVVVFCVGVNCRGNLPETEESNNIAITVTPKVTEDIRLISGTPAVTVSLVNTEHLENTRTPIPTLSQMGLREKVIELAMNNGNCKLPCIWGISPMMHYSDLLQYLQQFPEKVEQDDFSFTNYLRQGELFLSFNINDYEIAWQFNQNQDEQGDVFPNLTINFIKNQKIVSADSSIYSMYDTFTLEKVFLNYPDPSRIIMFAEQQDINRLDIEPSIYLVLLYEKEGFFIEYEMVNQKVGLDFLGCPHNTKQIAIGTWNPGTITDLDAIFAMQGLPMSALNYEKYFKNIEEVTEYNLDRFIQEFSIAGANTCFKTPVELWRVY
jgi:hypothetical protein